MRSSLYLSMSYFALTLILTACAGGGGGGGAAGGGAGAGVAPLVIAKPAITPIVTGNVDAVTTGTGAQVQAGSYAKGMGASFFITTGTGKDFFGVTTVSSNNMPVNSAVKDVAITFTNGQANAKAIVSGLANSNVSNLPLHSSSGGVTLFGASDGTGLAPSQMLISSTIGAVSLDHSNNGFIINKTTNVFATNTKTIGGELTYFYGGKEATNMPTTGTASYTGTYKGHFIANGYAPAMHTGHATMTADFAAGTVSGAISNITSSHMPISGSSSIVLEKPTVGTTNFTGTVTGTQYTGTTTTTGGTYSGNGAVAGGFFGPGAVETAGVMTNRLTNASGQTASMLGTFGAKK